jgi:hypothetical protein
MKSAQSEAEAYALKILSRSWVGLAGQIDRYNALVRGQRRTAAKFIPDGRQPGQDSASVAGIDLAIER